MEMPCFLMHTHNYQSGTTAGTENMEPLAFDIKKDNIYSRLKSLTTFRREIYWYLQNINLPVQKLISFWYTVSFLFCRHD